MKHFETKLVARRELLRGLGAVIATVPLAKLIAACGGSDAPTGTSGADAGTSAADATAADAGLGAAGEEATIAWGTGGTAAMTGKASYPNPFASGAPTTCALTCELTEGPCYDSASVELQDISYGQNGLPLRMYIQLVDETCTPVKGAVVDVWHVAPTGKYSGDDSVNEDIAFCTGSDKTYEDALWFRGKQTSDANGVVYFDTCFPGWYSSRTVHIHMTITVNGTAFLTTQLVFEDALDDSIIGDQPIYDTRGKRDTTNLTDTVVTASTYQNYLFTTEQMSDGAMLAWKTLILRSSASETLCGASTGGTGGGGGGEGGPPGM